MSQSQSTGNAPRPETASIAQGLPEPAASRRRRLATLGFLAVAVGILAWRLRECFLFPINTTDVLRHLFYGLFVWRDGLSAAARPLRELNPSLTTVAWSNLPYNYPIMALGFDSLVGRLWPSVFFYKFTLTIVEAATTWGVYVYTRERWLAALYWAAPLSIWWVSREAQFEPVQNLFIIAALCLSRKHSFGAFLMLALAIQTKLLAVLLLPLFVVPIATSDPRRLRPAILGFLCGCIPSFLIESFAFPSWSFVFKYSNPGVYNPYYWYPFAPNAFRWIPGWLIVVNEVLTFSFLGFLLVSMAKSANRLPYIAPLLLMLLVKFHSHVQPWYLLLLPVLLLPIEDRRRRLLLILFALFLDFHTVAQLIAGPFGYVMPHYFDGLTVFTTFQP